MKDLVKKERRANTPEEFPITAALAYRHFSYLGVGLKICYYSKGLLFVKII